MNLLIQEPPLQVLPSLAVRIGLNEALVLQQLHYWLLRSPHDDNGERWIYNTYDQWTDQFPFWSERTLRRIFGSLEGQGVVSSRQNMNRDSRDRTKWYTINYQNVQTHVDNLAGSQAGQSDRSHPAKLAGSSLNRDYVTETTAETTSTTTKQDRFNQFWEAYPRKKAKGNAERAWSKINPDQALTNTIIAAVHEQKRSHDWIKEEGTYIPYPATWLNGKCWEDEVRSKPKTSITEPDKNWTADGGWDKYHEARRRGDL